jgi:hypothetical protein
MATNAQLLEESLLVIWSGRNADERLKVMKKIYAPDVHFYETDTTPPYVGHEAINALISKLQSQWPAGTRFELTRPSEANHAVQIGYWSLGPHGAKPIATGKDVAFIENGMIKSFYLFLQ